MIEYQYASFGNVDMHYATKFIKQATILKRKYFSPELTNKYDVVISPQAMIHKPFLNDLKTQISLSIDTSGYNEEELQPEDGVVIYDGGDVHGF